ncbi:MAG: ATP synthase F1 subunit epsilon [Bacteroidia bacterium]
MQLDIITADKTLFSDKVKSVSLPGSKGRFQVLKNHADLISSLVKGVVKIEAEEGGQKQIEINGGVVEVTKNKITVLA